MTLGWQICCATHRGSKALQLCVAWLLTHRLHNEERSSQQTGCSVETQLQILGRDMTQTEEISIRAVVCFGQDSEFSTSFLA